MGSFAGASLNTLASRVSLHHNGRSFTLQYFSTYVRQHYPHEAASLQCEITKAPESNSTTLSGGQGTTTAQVFAHYQPAAGISQPSNYPHTSPIPICNPPRMSSAGAKSERRNWWTRYFTIANTTHLASFA